MKQYDNLVKMLVRIALITFIIYGVIKVFPTIFNISIPFLIAWIISLIVTPVVNFLDKKYHVNRKISAFIMILITLLIGGFLLYLLTSKLIAQLQELIIDFPRIYQYIIDAVTEFAKESERILKNNSIISEEKIMDVLENLEITLMNNLSEVGKISLGIAGNVAKKIPIAIIFTIITILASFFITIDKDKMNKFIFRMLSKEATRKIIDIREHFFKVVGGYVQAQLKIMSVVFCVLLIGLNIIGVKYTLLLAFAIALLDAIPAFGTGIALTPWGIITIVGGDLQKGVSLMLLSAACFVTRQLIEPKIVGDSMGLPPLVTICAMYTGLKLFGPLGMLLGAPTAIIIVNLYKIGVFDKLIKGMKESLQTIKQFIE